MASARFLRVVVLLLYLKNAYTQQPIGSLNIITNNQGFQHPTNAYNLNAPVQRNAQQVNLQDLYKTVKFENSGNQQQPQRSSQKPVATLQFVVQPEAQQYFLEGISIPYSTRPYSNSKGSIEYTSAQQKQMPQTNSMKSQPTTTSQLKNQALTQNSIFKQEQLSDQNKGVTQYQASVQNPSSNEKQEQPRLKLIAGQPIITSIQFEPTGARQETTMNQESNFKTTFHPISPEITQLLQSQQNQGPIQIQPSVVTSSEPVQYTFSSVAPPMENQPIVSYLNPPANSQPLVTYLSQPYNFQSTQPSTISVPYQQPSYPVHSEIDLRTLMNHPNLVAAENAPPMQTLMSYILSEMQSSATPKYPTMSYPASNKGSKSSLKSILPLILNLLQERQCGCRNHVCIDNNDSQEPQIFGGYSNQMVYGQRENEALPNINNNMETDIDNSRNDLQNNLMQYVVGTNSVETSDEDDAEDSGEYVDDD